MRQDKWLPLKRAKGAVPELRVYCFPHAGGSAGSFADWQSDLDDSIELCPLHLPGRGARMREYPPTNLPALVRAIAEEALHDDGVPFVFFGHSLGALVAFELAHLLRYQPRRRQPRILFISGADAPSRERGLRRLHLLDDAALLKVLESFDGTPPEILQDRDLVEMMLPAIRADFAMAANYQYVARYPLSIPIVVFAGHADTHVSEIGADGWARETTAPCRMHWFSGGHFFVQTARNPVLAAISSELRINGLLAGCSKTTES